MIFYLSTVEFSHIQHENKLNISLKHANIFKMTSFICVIGTLGQVTNDTVNPVFVSLFIVIFHTYIHSRFKHALLDSHLGCLLVGFITLLVVNEREEGIVSLHLPNGSGLEMVLRCKPSTFQPLQNQGHYLIQ